MNDNKYRPLSPWAYFGYQILFAIPVIGIILLIFYSLSDSNINRRNFARSYFCVYVLAIVIFIIGVVFCGGFFGGFFDGFFDKILEIFNQ